MKILVPEEKIQQRVREMAAEIDQYYAGKHFILVALVNGAMFFAVDLARALKGDFFVDTIAASSYSGEHSTGCIRLRGNTKLPVKDCDVLLVDGVLDTGLTLISLVAEMKQRGAKTVRTAVLVSKKVTRHPKATGFNADWVGFELPNEFLVGCGMDNDEKDRQLTDICAVEDSDR